MTRTAVVLTLVALVLFPGCGLLELPFRILDAILGILFFWASPAPPGAVEPATDPLPLSVALEQARAESAIGEVWFVPADAADSFDPGPPPAPGAVLRAIPVAAE